MLLTLRIQAQTEVSVSNYTKLGRNLSTKANVAERTTLKVNGREFSSSASVSSGDGDGERKAVAFDSGVVGRMTPTMKRFTLGGKVAVVTG